MILWKQWFILIRATWNVISSLLFMRKKRSAHSCPKSLWDLGFLIASQTVKIVVSSTKDFDNTTLIVIPGIVIQVPLPVIAARADLPTLFVRFQGEISTPSSWTTHLGFVRGWALVCFHFSGFNLFMLSGCFRGKKFNHFPGKDYMELIHRWSNLD